MVYDAEPDYNDEPHSTRSEIREYLTTDFDASALESLVTDFVNDNFDLADYDAHPRGIDVTFENREDTVVIDGEEKPVDEPFLRLFFRYWHENATDDPNEPFLNGVPQTELHCQDDDGEWHHIDWFEPHLSDEVMAEVKGRFAQENPGLTKDELSN